MIRNFIQKIKLRKKDLEYCLQTKKTETRTQYYYNLYKIQRIIKKYIKKNSIIGMMPAGAAKQISHDNARVNELEVDSNDDEDIQMYNLVVSEHEENAEGSA
jgi:hypothetical protein